MLPPGFPVPLHWLILIGIAGLIRDEVATLQSAVAPPPFAEPLHWVTVAPVVVAGNGLHSTDPPPPFPDPTHWFTVAAVTGWAPGGLPLMLFVTVTRQMIGWAASLSEPLHCRIDVTRLVECVTNVPFPCAQGWREQCRVTVVVELVFVPLMVLTTVTVHLIPVVLPIAPGPWPLHWLTVRSAACAADGDKAAIAKENALASSNAISARCHGRREVKAWAGAVERAVLMKGTVFRRRTGVFP